MKSKSYFKRFVADERGSFSIEAVLMFPMLVWAFMAMYVFFEGLRESNINLKATYTIADLMSRESETVTQTYIDNMNVIYKWMARTPNPVEMRMSVVRYDLTADEHVLHCSLGAGGKEQLLQEQVRTNVTPHVPIMPDASFAIVVETWVDYTPIMDVPLIGLGMEETEIYNIVVTSPRVSDMFSCPDYNAGTGSNHNDGVDESDNV